MTVSMVVQLSHWAISVETKMNVSINYAFMYTCMCVCMHAHKHTCAHTPTHVCTPAHASICTNLAMHKSTCIVWCMERHSLVWNCATFSISITYASKDLPPQSASLFLDGGYMPPLIIPPEPHSSPAMARSRMRVRMAQKQRPSANLHETSGNGNENGVALQIGTLYLLFCWTEWSVTTVWCVEVLCSCVVFSYWCVSFMHSQTMHAIPYYYASTCTRWLNKFAKFCSKQLKFIFCEDQFLQMWIHLNWAETNSYIIIQTCMFGS